VKALSALALLLVSACGWNAAGNTGCSPASRAVGLPEALGESSGVAWSKVRDGVLLSHNDGGHEATIFALGLDGSLIGEVPLEGARNRDWEDIATAPCEEEACIYVADIGDNELVRNRIVLYRLRDTGVYDGTPRRADTFPMILPDGPRDMESVFVLPGEEVFFISKGRSHAVTLYRYPPPLRAGETVALEAVQTFSEGRLSIPRQVTGADASPDGNLVAIRSYEALSFFRTVEGRLAAIEGGKVMLRTLNEAQGEAVGLGNDGRVVLTSEGVFGRGATMILLTCAPGGRPD
jgi:hypothetical protein